MYMHSWNQENIIIQPVEAKPSLRTQKTLRPKSIARPTGNVAPSAESRRIKCQKWTTEREYTFKAFNQLFCKCLILKKSTVCIGLHGGQHKYKIARLKVTKSSFQAHNKKLIEIYTLCYHVPLLSYDYDQKQTTVFCKWLILNNSTLCIQALYRKTMGLPILPSPVCLFAF